MYDSLFRYSDPSKLIIKCLIYGEYVPKPVIGQFVLRL